jgi:mono/diheme cytochrome c family protein
MLSRLSVSAVLMAFAATAVAETPFDPAQLPQFSRDYCAKCHNADKQKGDFNFEPHVAKVDMVAGRKVWEKVAELLENREMPPEDKPQPTDAQRTALIQWIDRQLSAGDAEAKNPGRVTLRRLNNEEYRNTIRDLLAVDYNPDDFPQDETAYGFDTIADALTLPPLLMEKYLQAADQIVTRALANDKQGPPSKLVPGVTFRSNNSEAVRPQDDVSIGFFREGDANAEVQFGGDGEYTLRFHLYGDQAGPDLPRLAISLDGQSLATFDVKERGRPGVYEIKVPIKGTAHKLTAAFLNNYNESSHPDPKMRGDRNVYLTEVDVIGPMHEKQQPPESFRRIFTHMPAAGEEAKVTRELLRAFASRALSPCGGAGGGGAPRQTLGCSTCRQSAVHGGDWRWDPGGLVLTAIPFPLGARSGGAETGRCSESERLRDRLTAVVFLVVVDARSGTVRSGGAWES